MYVFPLACFSAFLQKKKCISMHAEMHLQNHGIRLVVARHCIVFTSSRSCVCVLHWYGQHACEKVAHPAAFLCAGKVPASGNTFMVMVTVVCAPSDDYVTGCLLTRGGQQNVGYAPDG